MRNFWDIKTRLRKYLQITNKTMLVIEFLAKDGRNIGDVVEYIMQESPVYRQAIDALERDYPGLKKEKR
jgi:hypothetical protein